MANNLVARSPEAEAWIDQMTAAHEGGPTFGQVVGSVIWSDATDANGELLLPVDPADVIAKINARPFPLLMGHDPGRPVGKVLAAEVFRTTDGSLFVAAVLGLYGGAPRLRFADLGLDIEAPGTFPLSLPDLPADFRYDVAADPKEVETAWLEALAQSAPVRVRRQELSHNAAEPTQSLIIIGTLFATLVWNPFVTTFAKEAGKDAYAAVREGLKHLLTRLSELKNPVIEIQSHHQGCDVSFILRGKNVARAYTAHEALPEAAARAERLIARMIASRVAPVRLVYEFHTSQDRWYPSYAELDDGRIVTDDMALIAAENLPTGLSLGLHVDSEDHHPVIPRR
jgi:hypothetical protein